MALTPLQDALFRIRAMIETAPVYGDQIIPILLDLCELAGEGGGSGWLIIGNAGTSPPANFAGTTDNAGFALGQNGIIVQYIGPTAVQSPPPNEALPNTTWLVQDAAGNVVMNILSNGISGTDEVLVANIGDTGQNYNGTRVVIDDRLQTTNIWGNETIVQKVGGGNVSFTVLGVITIQDGTQAAGNILTSDASGNGKWLPNRGLAPVLQNVATSGGTINLTNNSANIITASGGITTVTINFPTGVTGDAVEVNSTQQITLLGITITGTGTGSITTERKTALADGNTTIFHNVAGAWY